MNKYSYLALMCAVIIGLLIGSFFQSNRSDKELSRIKEEHKQEFLSQIKNSKDSIKVLDVLLVKKDSILQHDALKIEKLEFNLKISKAKINKQREEAKKLSSDEKEIWFVTRYDSLPNIPADSVSIPDTVAARVIDDLILKDGLVNEVKSLDSVVTVYKHKDTTYQDIIKTHESKDVQQDSIISNQDELYKDLSKENKALEKEIRREKLKKVGIKLLAIGEAVLIVLLIL